MKGLFLDDERNPSDVTWECYPDNVEWFVVRSYPEFKKALTLNQWDLISFDHDLQDFNDSKRERTGYDCVKFLVQGLMWDSGIKLKDPTIYFHTKNPIGKKNMSMYWQSYLNTH